MKFKVTYSLYYGISPSDKEAMIAELRAANIDVVECAHIDFFALDESDLAKKLAEYGIAKDAITSTEVLLSDEAHVLKHHEILAIAESESSCVDFDWTSDNVVSYAEKIIAAYEAKKKLQS